MKTDYKKGTVDFNNRFSKTSIKNLELPENVEIRVSFSGEYLQIKINEVKYEYNYNKLFDFYVFDFVNGNDVKDDTEYQPISSIEDLLKFIKDHN